MIEHPLQLGSYDLENNISIEDDRITPESYRSLFLRLKGAEGSEEGNRSVPHGRLEPGEERLHVEN